MHHTCRGEPVQSAVKVESVCWLIRAAGQIESDKDQIVLIESDVNNGNQLMQSALSLRKFPFLTSGNNRVGGQLVVSLSQFQRIKLEKSKNVKWINGLFKKDFDRK